MVTANVELTVLDRAVRVASLAPERVRTVFHTLLRLTFFSSRDERFFSISVSPAGAISIIADAEDLASFAPDDLQQDGTDWSVFIVSEGVNGFESVGVVERITGPLASAASTPRAPLSRPSLAPDALPLAPAPPLRRWSPTRVAPM